MACRFTFSKKFLWNPSSVFWTSWVKCCLVEGCAVYRQVASSLSPCCFHYWCCEWDEGHWGWSVSEVQCCFVAYWGDTFSWLGLFLWQHTHEIITMIRTKQRKKIGCHGYGRRLSLVLWLSFLLFPLLLLVPSLPYSPLLSWLFIAKKCRKSSSDVCVVFVVLFIGILLQRPLC